MSLPMLLKGWNRTLNNAIVGGITGTFVMSQARATLLLDVKNQLLAWGHCSVKRSCDGSATADSDLWADIGDIITNAQGTPFSWTVLSFDSAGFELLISGFATTAASPWTGGSFTFRVSPIAGGGFSGGDLNNNPTAALTLELSTGDAGNYSAEGTSADPTMSWNLVQATDGLNTRLMINFNGKATAFWSFEQLIGSTVAETYPNYFLVRQSTTSSTPADNQTELNSGTYRWHGGSNIWSRFDNSGVERFCNVMVGSTDEGLLTEVLVGNPVTNEELFLPVDFQQVGSRPYAYRGRIPDMYVVRDGLPEGTMFPTVSPFLWAQMGNLAFHWDGSGDSIAVG